MKTITYEVTKLILTSDEKQIRRTWDDWKYMTQMQNVLGYIVVITAKWSGYPGQTNCNTKNYMHATLAQNPSIHPYSGIITFTDNTTLNVVTEKMTIGELLKRRITKNVKYLDLINSMLKAGQGYWDLRDIEDRTK